MPRRKKPQSQKQDPILEYITKKYGEGKIFKLPGKDEFYDPKDFISTGSLCLNYLITGDYRCGVPRKKPIEIYGPESVGKTTLALHVAIEATKQGLQTLDCDAEKGLNEFYAKQLGINNEHFYYFQPETGEEAFTITEDLLKKFPWDLYIFDSVGGMKTKAILDGDYSEANMGSNARLMGKAIRRLSTHFFKYNIAPIFINQLGSKIGGYGNPEETKGGKTLKYHLWTRLEVRAPRGSKVEEKVILSKGVLDDVINEEEIRKKKKEEKEKSKTVETGTIINVKAVKNKLFMPRRTCRVKIIYGRGFDRDFDLIEFLDMQEIIKKTSAKKLVYNDKSWMTSRFLKMYKDDKVFHNEIRQAMEDKRLSQQIITEDETFFD